MKWTHRSALRAPKWQTPPLERNTLASTTPHARPAAPSVPQQRTTVNQSATLAQAVGPFEVEEPRHPLDVQVEAVGQPQHINEIRRAFRAHRVPITAAGSTLKDVHCILVPEHWNEDDANAVAVRVGVNHVGYIPADLAGEYSPGLLRLAESGRVASCLAHIWAQTDNGVIRAQVTVQMPAAAAFS